MSFGFFCSGAAIDKVLFDVDGTLARTEEVHFVPNLPWRWGGALSLDLLRVTGGKERIAHFVSRETGAAVESELFAALHERKTTIYTEMVVKRLLLRRRPYRRQRATAQLHGSLELLKSLA